MSSKKEAEKSEELDVEEIIDEELEEVEALEEEISSTEEAEIKQLQKQLSEQNDMFLRLRAEYDNFRKRTAAEKSQIYNNAVSDTVSEILSCMDNFERALKQENASGDDMKKGVEMIYNQFLDSLEKLGVKPVGEAGEDFDPNLHNAVSHIEDDGLGDNTIAEVLQKGYMLGDRVVRHAVVQVAN